jgi:AraC family transcriptional regulator of adaptative response/methylated-DNA-[protein]-cysteine methyltransferase
MTTPNEPFLDSRDFRRIARAIRFIDGHFREQPRLTTIAAFAGLSEFHFNRLFRRWAGVTPRQYLAFVTARAAHQALIGTASVLEAAYTVGLSGPGRLHDLMVTLEAVSPGELKTRGSGLAIRYGFSDTPFGSALIASTPRGVCRLRFHEPRAARAAATELMGEWPLATLVRDDASASDLSRRIFGVAPVSPSMPLRVTVKGTNFQLKVWQALLTVGASRTTTYREVAQAAGVPGSERAVGNAVGSNPVAWLIPCHRVLRTNGSIGGYASGEDRKRAMLAWEANDIIQPPGRAAPASGSMRASSHN